MATFEMRVLPIIAPIYVEMLGDNLLANGITVTAGTRFAVSCTVGVEVVVTGDNVTECTFWSNSNNRPSISGAHIEKLSPEMTSMSGMFMSQGSLDTFTVSSESVTSGITDLSHAWSRCYKILDFPAIDTSSVTEMTNTWYRCEGLTSFPLINTSSLLSAVYAWGGCRKLTSFPPLEFPLVTDASNTWSGCMALKEFPVINFPKATKMISTWSGCTSLTSFPLIEAPKVVALSNTWQGCSGLITFPTISFPKAADIGYAWMSCSGLIDFPALYFPAADFMWQMWKECSSLKCIGGINTTSATSASSMFTGCDSLRRPNATEQAAIMDTGSGGLDWVNDREGCYKNKESISYKVENINGQDIVKEYIIETLEDNNKKSISQIIKNI